MNLSRDIAGKTLAQASPDLYDEVVRQLEARNMSPAACMLQDDEIAAVLAHLKTARIGDACACGQLDCKTYRFETVETPGVSYHTVRFNVRGELLMGIGGDGRIYTVQRLYDFSDKQLRRYVRDPDGLWREPSG